jgi:hypothetical protein
VAEDEDRALARLLTTADWIENGSSRTRDANHDR